MTLLSIFRVYSNVYKDETDFTRIIIIEMIQFLYFIHFLAPPFCGRGDIKTKKNYFVYVVQICIYHVSRDFQTPPPPVPFFLIKFRNLTSKLHVKDAISKNLIY